MNGEKELRRYENLESGSFSLLERNYGSPLERSPLGYSEQITYVLDSGAVFQGVLNGDLKLPKIMGNSKAVEEGERELNELGLVLKIK